MTDGARRGVSEALGRGWTEVGRAPRLVLAAWGASVAIALPLAVAMHRTLADAIGPSEAGQRLVDGWDPLWFRAFSAQAQGLARSFEPGIVGIGAVFEGLDALVTGQLGALPGALLAAGLVYAVAWCWLSGALLTRYLHGDAGGSPWRGGARHFGRMLGLFSVALPAWLAIFAGVLPWLSGVADTLLRDVVDERVAFAVTLGKLGLVWTLAWTVSLVHDAAKLASVADPERTLGQAIAAGATFVRRRAASVYGVSLAVLGALVVVVLASWVVAPGTDQANPLRILVAFSIGQASILARIAVRCLGYASLASLWCQPRSGPP